MLREAYRVIRPGRTDRDRRVQSVLAVRRASAISGASSTPPWNGNFIALYRLKDWLTLLGFDVVGGRLDCYVPPFAQREMARTASRSSRRAGDRWWPIAGGVYFLRATKHVHGHARDHAGARARERRDEALAPAAGRAREGLTTNRIERLAGERRRARPKRGPRAIGSAGIPMRRSSIYTDGACKGNPGPGGWGALLDRGRPREGALRRRARDDQQSDGADRGHPRARSR